MYTTSDGQTDGQTDRQTDDGRRWPPNALASPTGRGHNNDDNDKITSVMKMITSVYPMHGCVVEVHINGIFGSIFADSDQRRTDKKRRWNEHGSAVDRTSRLCHSRTVPACHPPHHYHTVGLWFKTYEIPRSTVCPEKVVHQTHGNNFDNSSRIFKILSLLEREVNFTMLLHYLAKVRSSSFGLCGRKCKRKCNMQ